MYAKAKLYSSKQIISIPFSAVRDDKVVKDIGVRYTIELSLK